MSQTYEILFTQLLAANQRKVRKEAIWKLGDYITEKSRSGQAFSVDDLTKLWKGLFYCLYMTDKSYQQEIVANKITSFIHLFKSSAECMSFVRIGFDTVIQEWNGIDKYRLDKFMMLIRRLFRELLIYLRKNKWACDELQMYLSIIEKTIICPRDYHNKIPLGVKLHFCDLYLEEIAKIGQENLDNSLILLFLQPYIQVLLFATSMPYVEAVVRDIFQYLIRQTDLVLKKEEQILRRQTSQLYSECVEDNEDEESEDDNAIDSAGKEESAIDLDALDPRAGGVDVYLPQLKPDFDAVADALLEAASQSELKKSRRQLIYKLVRELKDTANKSYPFKIPKESYYKCPSEAEKISTALSRLKKCKAGSRSSKRKSHRESLDTEVHAEMPILKKKKSANVQTHSSSLTLTPKCTESKSTKKKLPSDFSVYELSQIKGQPATARRETRKGQNNQASGFKVSDIPSHLLSNVGKETQRSFQKVFKDKSTDSDSVSPLRKSLGKNSECHLECSNVEILLKLRKQLKKKKLNQSRKMKKQNAPISALRTPGSKKTIQINLKRNQEHAYGDYCKDVQKSPIIPFSADKVPTTSVLKPSPSPILVQKPSLKTLKTIPTVATSTQHVKKTRKKR